MDIVFNHDLHHVNEMLIHHHCHTTFCNATLAVDLELTGDGTLEGVWDQGLREPKLKSSSSDDKDTPEGEPGGEMRSEGDVGVDVVVAVVTEGLTSTSSVSIEAAGVVPALS